jgi:predicted esterase
MAGITRIRLLPAILVLGWVGPVSAQPDVADIPSQQLSVAGDPNLSYFLIGPVAKETPPDGFGLVVVLPGGDGKADFLPFVKRVYKYALGGQYIVAQPIAVKWSPQQAIVWPTQSDNLPYVKRTTEQFVDEIVKIVRGQYKIDPRRIFTMSWSSSGPAGYALSLQKDSPILGSYIAMSVFKPEKLGPLTQAQGHAYFIEHSPQDRVCPFRMAQEAVRALTAAGAKVQFNQYDGGHGWRGAVYPRITAAIQWLEQNAQARSVVEEKKTPSPPPDGTTSDVLLRDSFEEPKEWTRGAPVAGVEYLWDRSQAYQGQASLSLKKTVNRYFPIAQWWRAVPCSGATALSVSVWIKAQEARKATFDVQFYNSTGKMLGHEWAAYIGPKETSGPATTHDWKEYKGEVNVPPNTARVNLAPQIYGPGQVWFDELLVRQKRN